MVHVSSIIRALLLAAVAVSATTTSVHAQDAQQQQPAVVEVAVNAAAAAAIKSVETAATGTCVSPHVVAQYETKLEKLEKERSKWEKQIVASSTQWQTEKASLENKIAEERILQMVAAAEMTNVQKEAIAKVGSIERQMEASATHHQVALEKLQNQVRSLEKTVEELTKQLVVEQETLQKRESQVAEATQAMGSLSTKVKSLEREVALSKKKNDALRAELQDADAKLSLAALLSSYYDEGVVLADNAATALREQLSSAQGSSSIGVSESLDAIDKYTKSTCEYTEKLYAQYLAATVDPLLEELRRKSDPYVKRYQPLVESELKKAQKQAFKTLKLAQKRAQAAREDAVRVLQQTDSVAPYAHKIVDGALVVVLAPVVLVAVRLVFQLTWWLIRTALCIVTLGFCCGKKRSPKLKRKGSRKPLAASPVENTPPSSSSKKNKHQPTATTTSATSGSPAPRRGSGKKHK